MEEHFFVIKRRKPVDIERYDGQSCHRIGFGIATITIATAGPYTIEIISALYVAVLMVQSTHTTHTMNLYTTDQSKDNDDKHTTTTKRG